MSEEWAIEWASASVTPDGDDLKVDVRLVPGPPDHHWRAEFARLSDRLNSEMRGYTWLVGLSADRLSIVGVEPGVDETLRSVVDDLVQRTNEAASRTRAAAKEQARKDAQEAANRERAAREMTERLRRGPT